MKRHKCLYDEPYHFTFPTCIARCRPLLVMRSVEHRLGLFGRRGTINVILLCKHKNELIFNSMVVFVRCCVLNSRQQIMYILLLRYMLVE